MYNKSTKFDENRWSHFWGNKNINFLMKTTLNFERTWKARKRARDIRKGTLGIECERDWLVVLDAIVRRRTEN